MQVIAGELRGRRLHAPRGRAVRPTLGRVREAVFSILGARAAGPRVLDLYAGTGALGIEALSRGAEQTTFVERSRNHIELLRRNLEELGVAGRAEVRQGEVDRALVRLETEGRRYDLVLADPPYGRGLAESLLTRLGAGAILDEEAVVFVECGKGEALPERAGVLARMTERVYGETKAAFYRVEHATGAPDEMKEA